MIPRASAIIGPIMPTTHSQAPSNRSGRKIANTMVNVIRATSTTTMKCFTAAQLGWIKGSKKKPSFPSLF